MDLHKLGHDETRVGVRIDVDFESSKTGDRHTKNIFFFCKTIRLYSTVQWELFAMKESSGRIQLNYKPRPDVWEFHLKNQQVKGPLILHCVVTKLNKTATLLEIILLYFP
jgi:hypothetical protein